MGTASSSEDRFVPDNLYIHENSKIKKRKLARINNIEKYSIKRGVEVRAPNQPFSERPNLVKHLIFNLKTNLTLPNLT